MAGADERSKGVWTVRHANRGANRMAVGRGGLVCPFVEGA